VKNRGVLEPMLEAMFRTKPAEHWVGALCKHGVPCTVVRNLKEVLEDEQTAARNMTPEVTHPAAGAIRVLGVPVKLSETPGQIRCAAPLLGADTDSVLNELLGPKPALR
jgi:crotonobetainyl-CoA:carnitine CoA-transferase CaiB-like acyl-CoA transferase